MNAMMLNPGKAIEQVPERKMPVTVLETWGPIALTRYAVARKAKVGSIIKCPSCGDSFTKTTYQKTFCSNQNTITQNCKDFYWNRIREYEKRHGGRLRKAVPRYNNERSTNAEMVSIHDQTL